MSMLKWLTPRQRAAADAPLPDPYPERRRNSRALLLSAAVVMAALAAAPTGIAVVTLLAAVGVRVGLWTSRRIRQRSRAAAARAAADAVDGAPVGRDSQTGEQVKIPDRALAAHGLVLGASGSGKTTTLLTIAGHQIAKRRPVVVIDLKGSPGFANDLRLAAARAGRGMTLWTLDGGSVWNPLKHGNATELKDKLIATEHFTEPHYKRAAERYLQTAIQVHQERRPGGEVTLGGVVELLDPRRLAAAAAELPKARTAEVRDYLRSLTSDQLSAVRGLASRLALITESHTGQFLQPTPDTLKQVDVRDALNGGDVVLFSLNSSSYGQLAAQLGTMAVQDLVSAAGARLGAGGNPTARDGAPVSADDMPPQAMVVIDEFSALGSDNVLALLARGRESGVGVMLATQELSDLDRAGHGFREQVLGNTAVKIAHRQDVPASARAVSEMAGTFKDWERTYNERANGRDGTLSYGSSARIVDRPIVEPAQVQRLTTGEAVVTTKSPRSESHMTRIRRTSRDHAPER